MVTAVWLSAAVEKTWLLPGGDGGVPLDDAGEDAAQGLDAQGQGGHVQQQDVLHFALEHAGLDGGADGHHFVGVDALVGFLAEDLLDLLLDLGHAGHAAHQDDFVDVLGREPWHPSGLHAQGPVNLVDQVSPPGPRAWPG